MISSACKISVCGLLLTTCLNALPVRAGVELAPECSFFSDGLYIDVLDDWKAGQIVSQQQVDKFGVAKCFVSEPIGTAVFARMKGKSYKGNCNVPLADLRYLKVLHYNFEGHIQLGELVCHKDVASDLLRIFRTLYEARYPIERMVLVDEYGADDERSMRANNTSCFNYRTVAGSKKLSAHSLGKAIDINPLYNPYVRRTRQGKLLVNPQNGRPYANRNKAFAHKITKGDLLCRTFAKYGFTWGGSWKSKKDYQHFERR